MSNLIDRLAGVSDGLATKAPARLATTTDVPLSGLFLIDGVMPAEGDRIVVRAQADPVLNGIWNASTGPWTRALDFNGARDVVLGTSVFVSGGATNAETTLFVKATGRILPGRTPIIFVDRSSFIASGNDLLLRFTRPSDNTRQDFVFAAGQGGTVLTTGNFNPKDQSPDRLRFGGSQIILEDVYDYFSGSGRLGVRRSAETNYGFADIHMSRDTRNTVGPGAGVSSMFRMDAEIGPNNAHLYAFLTSMKLTKPKAGETRAEGTGSGHHVAQYSQLWTEFDTPVWTYCTELRDRFRNPTTPSIGIELGWYGDGADDNFQRIGLDLSYGAATVYNAGDNVQSVGIRIAPYFGQSDWDTSNYNPETGQSASVGRSVLKYGIQVAGNVGTGLDLSGMKIATSDTAILMGDNSRLKWTSGGEFGFFGNSLVIKPPGDAIIAGSAFTNADGYIRAFIPSIGNVKLPYSLIQ